MIEVLAEHTYTPEQDPRTRTVTEWSLSLREDSKGKWFSVCGFVGQDIGGAPRAEGTTHRYTQSSPIKKIEGLVCTTESGSTYTLVGPPSGSHYAMLNALKIDYDLNNPLPKNLLDFAKAVSR